MYLCFKIVQREGRMEHVQELADGGKVLHGPKLQQLVMVYRVDVHP